MVYVLPKGTSFTASAGIYTAVLPEAGLQPKAIKEGLISLITYTIVTFIITALNQFMNYIQFICIS